MNPTKTEVEKTDNAPSEQKVSTDGSSIPEQDVQVVMGRTNDPQVVALPSYVPTSQIATPDIRSTREELATVEGINPLYDVFYQTQLRKEIFFKCVHKFPSFENTFKSYILAKLTFLSGIVRSEDKVRLSPGKDSNPYTLGFRVAKLSRSGYPDYMGILGRMSDRDQNTLLNLLRNLNSLDGDDPDVTEKLPVFAPAPWLQLIREYDDLNQSKLEDVEVFHSFLSKLNSFEYGLKPLPDFDPRFRKVVLAGSMLSLEQLINKNVFMRRTYYDTVYAIIASKLVVPRRPSDKQFTDLLAKLNISSTAFSALAALPSALTSGQAEIFETVCMAVSFLNGIAMLSMDLKVTDPSPAAVVGLIIMKLMVEFGCLEPETVNKIDNYIYRHFISYLQGYRPQFDPGWDDVLAEDGRINYLTLALDNGVLTGELHRVVMDYFYTPSGPNIQGQGWAEGGMLTHTTVPTATTQGGGTRSDGIINVGQRDCHYRPTAGIPAFKADCRVVQFDKLVNFVNKLQRMNGEKGAFVYSGNERRFGEAYYTVLRNFTLRKEAFQMRAWRLDQAKRALGLSSLVFPKDNKGRAAIAASDAPSYRLTRIRINPLDGVSSLLLSDFTTVNTEDPNRYTDLINLGYDWQDASDEFCEIYWFLRGQPGSPKTDLLTSDNGFTKKERWENVFKIYEGNSEAPRNPIIQNLKMSLLSSDQENIDIVQIPKVTLSRNRSFVYRVGRAITVIWEPMMNYFGVAPEFFIGSMEQRNGRFKRFFAPLNPDVIGVDKVFDREQLNALKFEQRITPALKQALRNEETLKFTIPVAVEDVVTDGSIQQDKRIFSITEEGSVRIRGPIKNFITFEEQYVNERSNDKLYDETPVISVKKFTFYNMTAPEFYGLNLNVYEFLKSSVQIVKTNDKSYFVFEFMR